MKFSPIPASQCRDEGYIHQVWGSRMWNLWFYRNWGEPEPWLIWLHEYLEQSDIELSPAWVSRLRAFMFIWLFSASLQANWPLRLRKSIRESRAERLVLPSLISEQLVLGTKPAGELWSAGRVLSSWSCSEVLLSSSLDKTMAADWRSSRHSLSLLCSMCGMQAGRDPFDKKSEARACSISKGVAPL